MTKEQLNIIAHRAGNNLINLIKETEDQIIAAAHEVEQEAVANDKKPVLNIGASIKVDVDANTMTTAINFSVKHKAEVSNQIEDPNQVKMEFNNED